MAEHLDKPIYMIVVMEKESANEEYRVGQNSVTKIEAFTKSGMYSEIAYVRVYKNDQPHSEYCQHNILGTYFEIPAA